MHAEVRAEFKGAQEQRRGEGAVHHQRRADFIGDFRHPVDRAHAQQRIRDALHQDAAGFEFLRGFAYRVHIADVDKTDLDAAGSSTFMSRLTVAPYIALAARMERRRSVSAQSSAVCMAAIPSTGQRSFARFQLAHQVFEAAVEGLSWRA